MTAKDKLPQMMPNTEAQGFTARESWRIIGIMAEFVEGTERLRPIRPAVSIFGSARTAPDHPYYEKTERIARQLSDTGFSVISGGGPGIMEAANKGAFQAGGHSIGLNIRLPHEPRDNTYQTHSLYFNYFYSRKATFFMHSAAYVALPGGFGTMDELFEVLTLVQTRKVPAAPIVLIGVSFWSGLIEWFKAQLLANGLIAERDLDLFLLTDDVDAAMAHIEQHCIDCTARVQQAPTLPE